MLPEKKMVGAPSNPKSQSSTVLRLPEDLVTEILLHVPVKSLMKFKCVSKPWLSLISSPEFIKSHFATSSREGHYSGHQLLFTTQAPNSSMKHSSLSSALHNPSTHFSDIEYPWKNSKEPLWILGIVNELVCLNTGMKDLYVWNPVLRNYKHLPSPKSSLRGGSCIVAYGFGFGYDESNDDHKVVKMSCSFDNEGVYETEIMVYGLRADLWRRIEDFKSGDLYYEYDTGLYASGKLYWLANRISDLSQKKKIVSLDMTSEKYI